MRFSDLVASLCLGALMLSATLMCVMGHRLSAVFNRKLVRCLPISYLSIQSEVFRFRSGMRWEYGTFKITVKQVLQHWRGIFLGRSARCHLQAYAARTADEVEASSISRCHARLDFDETKQMFFIEDAESQNKTCWVPLDWAQSSTPKVLVGRLYLTQDIQLWLGDVPLSLRLLQDDSVRSHILKNPVSLGASTLLQLMGLVFCYKHTGNFSVVLCLPAILLTIAALRTFLHDYGHTPVPGIIFVTLTYGWVIYVSFSDAPDNAARIFSCALFCIGAAAICLPADVWNRGLSLRSCLQAACAFLVTFALYHFQVISSYDDALFVLILILVRQKESQKAML